MSHFSGFLALFLSVVLPIYAADLSDLTFSTTNGKVAITYCDRNAIGELVIPDTIEGNPVTSIGDGSFYLCLGLTHITIPNSITYIGEQAFRACMSLTSITIPDSVISIGKSAFSGCRNLTRINIPDNVASIGGYAFLQCHRLTTITIPEGVTSIGNSVFRECKSLTSITIGNAITSIGSDAFFQCTSLTTIVVSAGNVNYTGVDGVLFNTEMTLLHTYPAGKTGGEYNIPDGVTSIGEAAFSWCPSLTSITIPDSVTSIGERAFFECRNLTSITIPNSVTSIGEQTFGFCESLTSITIPDGVTSIEEGAFAVCIGLTSITIPDSVTSIGDYAFFDCTNLSSITFLGDAPTLGRDSFLGLPEGAKIIAGTESTGFGDLFGGLEVVYVEMEEPRKLEVQFSRSAVDQIALIFSAAAGSTYSIQVSSDMKSWELLESEIAGADDDVQRTFPISGRERFFRVLKNGLGE